MVLYTIVRVYDVLIINNNNIFIINGNTYSNNRYNIPGICLPKTY